MFSQKLFFLQFRLEFGRSCGVRGEGMDHTKRFPRTLAGFGLTGHGVSRISCFWEILETHFITKFLQIGPRASRLVKPWVGGCVYTYSTGVGLGWVGSDVFCLQFPLRLLIAFLVFLVAHLVLVLRPCGSLPDLVVSSRHDP